MNSTRLDCDFWLFQTLKKLQINISITPRPTALLQQQWLTQVSDATCDTGLAKQASTADAQIYSTLLSSS